MTDDNNTVHLPKLFDKHPELKARMVEEIKKVPKEEKKRLVDQFYKFINGDITWGEVVKINKRVQKEIAKIAYGKFKMKDYTKAESLFKGLAILDHTNWYYRAALGAIYQKQNRFEDAIDEYRVAIEIKEDEKSCLLNRGECYMRTGDFEAAKRDFETIANMKLPANSPWLVKANIMIKRVGLAKRKDSHG